MHIALRIRISSLHHETVATRDRQVVVVSLEEKATEYSVTVSLGIRILRGIHTSNIDSFTGKRLKSCLRVGRLMDEHKGESCTVKHTRVQADAPIKARNILKAQYYLRAANGNIGR